MGRASAQPPGPHARGKPRAGGGESTAGQQGAEVVEEERMQGGGLAFLERKWGDFRGGMRRPCWPQRGPSAQFYLDWVGDVAPSS